MRNPYFYVSGKRPIGSSNAYGGSPFYFSGPDNPTVCTDVPMEIMALDSSCTVAWVTYTAGDVLPRGSIVMGYWNGKPSYNICHIEGLEQSFGWFVEGGDVAFNEYFGGQTTTQFEILISVLFDSRNLTAVPPLSQVVKWIAYILKSKECSRLYVPMPNIDDRYYYESTYGRDEVTRCLQICCIRIPHCFSLENRTPPLCVSSLYYQ